MQLSKFLYEMNIPEVLDQINDILTTIFNFIIRRQSKPK